ncbi:MAG: DNA-deoxyinosine glycosylase [Oscillospiraceae bacterium]|nr:DNA-deoxyinosine glycosylase [Oscillospiraceae bacterium]
MIDHPIEPVFDCNSRVLILGSFPSVKSREEHFFYGHPQNRFWKVIAAVMEQEVPRSIAEKKSLLLSSGIALWDVIASCEITGSSDSSIRNVVPNDLSCILDQCDIRAIYINGKTALKYYDRHLRGQTGRDAICLPSTSPANAGWSAERLCEAWRVIRLDFSNTK